MPHEAGVLVAINGQTSLITFDRSNRGFFTNPTIEHAYYSFVTNGVQSLSIFVEHVDETRTWVDQWSDPAPNGTSIGFPASVDERLQITTIGLETTRTLYSESGFRLSAGLGLGAGLGGASAGVTNLATGATQSHSSFSAWGAVAIMGQVRARYTLFSIGDCAIDLTAIGRYWGYPYTGPLGSSAGAYNGPELRVLSEFGYLAGLSIGW